MIVIIEGCGNNIASLQCALARLGVTAELTSDPKKIQAATQVILPGVGNARNAMQSLQELKLINVMRELTQPVLGICLGMQLLFESSEEGDTDCLSIIPGNIKKFTNDKDLIVPHMGWNRCEYRQSTPLFDGIDTSFYQYFVHSYFAPINEHTVALTHYGENFSSAVQKDNFFGVQFHPEKSGKLGLQILKNFVSLS